MPPAPTQEQWDDMKNQVAFLSAQIKEIRVDQMRIIKSLCGDLEGNQDGILHRVSELERAEKHRVAIFVTCITTAIIGAGSAFWSVVIKGQK